MIVCRGEKSLSLDEFVVAKVCRGECCQWPKLTYKWFFMGIVCRLVDLL